MTIGRSRTWPLRAWPLKHIVDSLCELSHPAHFEFPPCSCAIERKTPQQCLFASIFAATTIAFDHVKCLALFHDVWRVRGAPRIIVLRCSFTAVYTYICQPWTILSLMEGIRPYALPSPSSRFGVILGRKMLTRLSENRQSGAFLTQA
jgi:hypothetical protein